MVVRWPQVVACVVGGLLGGGCPFEPTVDILQDARDASSTCGNGVREGNEACDGPDLGGVTCESLGYLGGQLRCFPDCRGYDKSGCVVSWTCGNGVREGTEECDGADLGQATCESLGYLGGSLGCAPNCSYDTTGCVASQCGNGIIEPGEVCDGPKLNGKTCQDLGFAGGDLACRPDCVGYDPSQCVKALCGNGTVDPGEECDNGAANSDTVPDACRTDCRLPYCGDGVADTGEACDGTDFRGETCQSLVQGRGLLVCAACSIDTSQCVDRPVGAPCEREEQCAGDRCWPEDVLRFPGGYCSQQCGGPYPCPPEAVCVYIEAWRRERCMDLCSDGTPCRPGYVCLPLDNDPRVMVCAPESWQ